MQFSLHIVRAAPGETLLAERTNTTPVAMALSDFAAHIRHGYDTTT